MIFEQLNHSACKTYLIASEQTKEALLVDPVLEQNDRYLEVLARRGLTLRYVVDTHVHADHLSGAAALRERLGVDYLMHHRSVSSCANRRVGDGDSLQLGEIPVRFLHTPGHTQDSITVVLPDRILTGDFLFLGEGGAGRTDLPGGDAGEHWDSLQKLASLPGGMLIYPGHDYHGHAQSTLAEERVKNERLAPRTREQYTSWLNGLKLGPAAWMADVIKANYACARDPKAAFIPVDQPACEVKGTVGTTKAELVRTLSVETLSAEMNHSNRPILLDVREREEFAGGHIPGARLIPVGQISKHIDELAGLEERPIVTVCRSGGRSATAAAVLTVAGFKNVRSLDGGMRRWTELGGVVTR